MKKLRAKIINIGAEKLTLESGSDVFELPKNFFRRPKLGETVVVTLASEKEDAMTAKEIAHELIKTALRGE